MDPSALHRTVFNIVTQAITCEVLLTSLLVMTVLLTAVDTDSNVLAALAIGLSITVDILAG